MWQDTAGASVGAAPSHHEPRGCGSGWQAASGVLGRAGGRSAAPRAASPGTALHAASHADNLPHVAAGHGGTQATLAAARAVTGGASGQPSPTVPHAAAPMDGGRGATAHTRLHTAAGEHGGLHAFNLEATPTGSGETARVPSTPLVPKPPAGRDARPGPRKRRRVDSGGSAGALGAGRVSNETGSESTPTPPTVGTEHGPPSAPASRSVDRAAGERDDGSGLGARVRLPSIGVSGRARGASVGVTGAGPTGGNPRPVKREPGASRAGHATGPASTAQTAAGSVAAGENAKPPARRRRRRFAGEVRDLLVRSFNDNPYPKRDAVEALATACEATPKQIRAWFHNRRSRMPNRERATAAAAKSARAKGGAPATTSAGAAPARSSPRLKLRRQLRPEATTLLRAYFSHCPKPTKLEIGRLADMIGVPHQRIGVWFTNQRSKQSAAARAAAQMQHRGRNGGTKRRAADISRRDSDTSLGSNMSTPSTSSGGGGGVPSQWVLVPNLQTPAPLASHMFVEPTTPSHGPLGGGAPNSGLPGVDFQRLAAQLSSGAQAAAPSDSSDPTRGMGVHAHNTHAHHATPSLPPGAGLGGGNMGHVLAWALRAQGLGMRVPAAAPTGMHAGVASNLGNTLAARQALLCMAQAAALRGWSGPLQAFMLGGAGTAPPSGHGSVLQQQQQQQRGASHQLMMQTQHLHSLLGFGSPMASTCAAVYGHTTAAANAQVPAGLAAVSLSLPTPTIGAAGVPSAPHHVHVSVGAQPPVTVVSAGTAAQGAAHRGHHGLGASANLVRHGGELSSAEADWFLDAILREGGAADASNAMEHAGMGFDDDESNTSHAAATDVDIGGNEAIFTSGEEALWSHDNSGPA